MAKFVKDYWENKPHIMRELCTIVSNHSLAADHQHKVVEESTLGGGIVGHGGQMITICGNFGLIYGVYVLPDTALSWVKAMSKVHKSVEDPHCKKFPIDLSHTMFVQHDSDHYQLMKAIEAAGLEGPPTHAKRVKFICRVVGEPECCREQMILVLKALREQCHCQAKAAGLKVDNLTIAYPLVT